MTPDHHALTRRAPAPAEHLADSALRHRRRGPRRARPTRHRADRPGRPRKPVAKQGPRRLRHRRVHRRLGHPDRRLPQGHRNTWSGTATNRHGKPRVMFTFSMTDCTPCPVRSRCTHAKTAARTVTLRPREQHELLRGLRAEVLVDAPTQEDAQVGLGVQPGFAAVATQVGRNCCAQDELVGRCDAGRGNRRGSHTSRCVAIGNERQHPERHERALARGMAQESDVAPFAAHGHCGRHSAVGRSSVDIGRSCGKIPAGLAMSDARASATTRVRWPAR
jgi:Transposase DDE domain